MPRKKTKLNRQELKPDTRYNSLQVSKFINKVLRQGKKDLAQEIVYSALEQVGKKLEKPPLEVLSQAINNVKPKQEVRSRRVGGAAYQVPMPVNRKRQQSLAIRWIREAARSRTGTPIARSLAQELLDAYKGEGTAITTRNNVHRMAEANKAFAHFAW